MRRSLTLVVAICVAAASAQARVIRVDIDAPGPARDGATWETAYLHPQDAVDGAAQGDEVWVAEGTYSVALAMKDGVAVYGGFAGTEIDRSERDWTVSETVLDGRGDHTVTGASDCVLDGLTVTGGYANGSVPDDDGGGMFNVGISNVTVKNCTFVLNHSHGHGAGICNDSVTGLSIFDCTFRQNDSWNWGGAIYNAGSSPQIEGCVFEGNTAYLRGGAIANRSGSLPSITRCTFVRNSTRDYDGGAVSDTDGSRATITNCTFVENISGHAGGAVRTINSTATIANCTFAFNWAGYRGGAIANFGGAPFLVNCTFYANESYFGQAVCNIGSSPMVTNCILWEDRRSAGAVLVDQESSTSLVTYSCVKGGWQGEDNVDSPPLFVDARNVDFKLLPGSPCIDAADGDAAPATDLDGNLRHDDPGTENRGTGAIAYADVGAYELQGMTPASWIVLVPPAEGEAWQIGRTVEIRWASSGDVAEVNIDISRDGGGTWESVGTGSANDGTFEWTVDDGGQSLPQPGCLLRVSDAGSTGLSATSGSVRIDQGVWYVDLDAPAGGDGRSWATAFRHPQDAADAAAFGDEARVAQGTYVKRGGADTVVLTMAPGVSVYGGFAGLGEPNPDERDHEANATILDGELLCWHVVWGASDACLDGFVVRRGLIPGNPGGDDDGAGMYNFHVGNLDVTNCIFEDNSTGSAGGAMYNRRVFSLSILNCEFVSNDALLGGGMFNEGLCGTIAGCIFSGNDASYGGGIDNKSGPTPSLVDCQFLGNTSAWGGGVYNSRSWPGEVRRCRFWGNSSRNVGGAMYHDGTATVESCVFTGNSAVNEGGAVGSRGWLHFVNCDLQGNTAGTVGGAIHSRYGEKLVVTNCTLWGNSAPTDAEISCEDAVLATVTFTCVEGGYAGTGNIGEDLVNHDPLFVDPDGPDDVPGTPDDDLRLSAGSPCIDSADGDAAPEFDIEGNPRDDDPDTPNTGVGTPDCADMGAYEFQTGNPWSAPPPPPADDSGCAPGGAAGAAIPFALLALLAAGAARRLPAGRPRV